MRTSGELSHHRDRRSPESFAFLILGLVPRICDVFVPHDQVPGAGPGVTSRVRLIGALIGHSAASEYLA